MTIQNLTAQELFEAKEAARSLIRRRAGDPPDLADFQGDNHADFPLATVRVVRFWVWVIILSAFVLSAGRAYYIGRATYAENMDVWIMPVLAGVGIVILSEAAQIGLTMAITVLPGLGRWGRRGLAVGAVMATGIALTANVQIGLNLTDGDPLAWLGQWIALTTTNPFKFLEITAPPTITLIGANVLKAIHLERARQYQRARAAYRDALAEYERQTSDPEQSPDWRITLANTIRDHIWSKNDHGRGRQARAATMRAFSDAQWSALVNEALNTTQWYDPGVQDVQAIQSDHSPSNRPALGTKAREVYDLLEHNEHLNALSARELAEKAGVSVGTVHNARQARQHNGRH